MALDLRGVERYYREGVKIIENRRISDEAKSKLCEGLISRRLEELRAQGKASPKPRTDQEFRRLYQEHLEGKTPESKDKTLNYLEDIRKSYLPNPNQVVADYARRVLKEEPEARANLDGMRFIG
jgi:hypothetical protein